MDLKDFIVVGENIHCTRSVKRGGIKMTELDDGTEAIKFKIDGHARTLAVPANWEEVSPNYAKGKCKHVAVAIYQALHGDDNTQQTAKGYLKYLADRQIQKGARFLDVNVDEYSSDPAKAVEIMDWLTTFLGEHCDTPLSIDSSNVDVLAKGLENCRDALGAPMVNSISLEREASIDVVKQFDAETIVNAAGIADLPCDVDGRLKNFREIIGKIDTAGIERSRLHLDPLVLPVSTDPMNAKRFLDATEAAANEFEGCNFNGGLSNVSFGMPNRKLLNQVFMLLCAERGTNGGIIDPLTMSVDAVAALDRASERCKLAEAGLLGEDMYGMEYLAAHRDGRLKAPKTSG